MKPGDGKPHYLVLQRRRVGAGHVQGPRDHALDAARADRRAAPSPRTRSARRRCYIYIRGEFTEPLRRSWTRRSRRRTPRASSARTRWARGKRIDVTLHQGAGAYICGEETALMNSLEGQARQSAHQAAVPGGRRASSACRRRSTTSRRSPPCRTSSTTARRGTRRSVLGEPEEHRHEALLGLRQRAAARQLRSHDGHSRSRTSCTTCAAARRRAGSSRRSSPAALGADPDHARKPRRR